MLYISNISLHFADALTNLQIKLRSSLAMCVLVILFSIYHVNVIVIFYTTAKFLQIYCWDILIWGHLVYQWIQL